MRVFTAVVKKLLPAELHFPKYRITWLEIDMRALGAKGVQFSGSRSANRDQLVRA